MFRRKVAKKEAAAAAAAMATSAPYSPVMSSIEPNISVKKNVTPNGDVAGANQQSSPAPANNSTALQPDNIDENKRYSNGTVIEKRYRLDKTIGKGSYGIVKMATVLTPSSDGSESAPLPYNMPSRVALKFIAKSSIVKPAHWTRIKREINLLKIIHHPHIVRLYEYFENEHDIVLVMEYITGNDLFDQIAARKEQRYEERDARPIFRQIVSALDYCHANRIIHRDMKPENVMVDERGCVKLIDFGFANLYHPRGHLETNCGSPLYAAPEIVCGQRYTGPEVDIWSCGVVLFAMLTGTLPFEHSSVPGLYKKICQGVFSMPSYLSSGAKDLIQSMLTVDRSSRATLLKVKTHPWTCGLNESSSSFLSSAVMPGYPPESFMPFRMPPYASGSHRQQELRPDILAAMVDYGYPDVETARQIITTQPDSPAYAIYCLLTEREQRNAYLRNKHTPTTGSNTLSGDLKSPIATLAAPIATTVAPKLPAAFSPVPQMVMTPPSTPIRSVPPPPSAPLVVTSSPMSPRALQYPKPILAAPQVPFCPVVTNNNNSSNSVGANAFISLDMSLVRHANGNFSNAQQNGAKTSTSSAISTTSSSPPSTRIDMNNASNSNGISSNGARAAADGAFTPMANNGSQQHRPYYPYSKVYGISPPVSTIGLNANGAIARPSPSALPTAIGTAISKGTAHHANAVVPNMSSPAATASLAAPTGGSVSLMAQAAAHVASRFRRLRELRFGSSSSNSSQQQQQASSSTSGPLTTSTNNQDNMCANVASGGSLGLNYTTSAANTTFVIPRSHMMPSSLPTTPKKATNPSPLNPPSFAARGGVSGSVTAAAPKPPVFHSANGMAGGLATAGTNVMREAASGADNYSATVNPPENSFIPTCNTGSKAANPPFLPSPLQAVHDCIDIYGAAGHFHRDRK